MKEIVAEIFKRNFDKVPEKTTPEEEIFLLKVCQALKQNNDTQDTINSSGEEQFLSAYATTLATLSEEEQKLIIKSLLTDTRLNQGEGIALSEQQSISNGAAIHDLEEYLPILTSSEDLCTIYTDIIAPKATAAETKLFELMNSGKDMEAIEYNDTPEYRAYGIFVLNDRVLNTNETQLEAANQEFLENCKKCKEDEIPEIPNIHYASTGNAKDMKALLNACPEILQMLGDMRADANMKYAASGLTAGYVHPRSADKTADSNTEIAELIDDHPKTALALAILSEQRAALGLPAEQFKTAADLQKRLEKSDIRDIANRISYTDRTGSLKAATQLAESYAIIERTSRGKDVHTA